MKVELSEKELGVILNWHVSYNSEFTNDEDDKQLEEKLRALDKITND